jgi:hypothetical protein
MSFFSWLKADAPKVPEVKKEVPPVVDNGKELTKVRDKNTKKVETEPRYAVKITLTNGKEVSTEVFEGRDASYIISSTSYNHELNTSYSIIDQYYSSKQLAEYYVTSSSGAYHIKDITYLNHAVQSLELVEIK